MRYVTPGDLAALAPVTLTPEQDAALRALLDAASAAVDAEVALRYRAAPWLPAVPWGITLR